MTLTKNPNYFEADKINLDEVEILTVAESILSSLCLKMVSWTWLYSTRTWHLSMKDRVYHILMALMTWRSNLRNKYLANKDLRLALNYAINREEYIMLAHNGLYTPNLRYVLPQVSGVENHTVRNIL